MNVRFNTTREDTRGSWGDSYYKFRVGPNEVKHQNDNRVSIFDPSTVSKQSTVSGTLYKQTPAADGFYDSCHGYKLILRVTYKVIIPRTRLRIVPKAPKT